MPFPRHRAALLPLLLSGVLAALAGCQKPAETSSASAATPVVKASPAKDPRAGGNSVSAGVARMRQRLEDFEKTARPENDRFLNRRRAETLEQDLEKAKDAQTATMIVRQLAIEYMNAGDFDRAIYLCSQMHQSLKQNDPKNESGLKPVPYLLQAIAYMRMGETQNCCASASANACLMPIKGDGIHTKQDASKNAISLLTGLLEHGYNDLGVRWLLNVAYMTLGQYPDKVPAKWLIPPSAFAPEYDIKTFPNIAPKLGLDVLQLAGGTIADDFNNDGNLDLMVSSFGLKDEMHYFVSNGDGTFTDRTKEAGLLGELAGQNLIQADYDNDGNMDFLILRGGWRGKGGHLPKSLLHNNGDGTFSDVTEEAGLLSTQPCMTAVWFDYNRDGKLDLFLGNESAEGEKNPCQLFRNNGDGTFTDVSKEVGLDVSCYAKAAVVADYDGDGWPDLFVSCYREPNKLFHNDGGKHFTEVGAKAGVTKPLGSFSCFFFDYDNDGRQDLLVVDYDIDSVSDVIADYIKQPRPGRETARLYHNRGDGTFEDVTERAHLNRVLYGMGLNFGDLDNDGWLDFYVGTGAPNLSALIPKRMFRNAEGKFFQDVTQSGNFGHLQKGHGISFADFNNDGTQDVYESMGGAFEGDTARSVLYQNPGHGNHWLKLKLEGAQSCRDGHGALIQVVVALPGGGTRSIYRQVGSGGSFGANPLRQEIGLGNATAIQQVQITWPATQKKQVVTGLALGGAYTIREGDARPQPLALKPFRYGGTHTAPR